MGPKQLQYRWYGNTYSFPNASNNALSAKQSNKAVSFEYEFVSVRDHWSHDHAPNDRATVFECALEASAGVHHAYAAPDPRDAEVS